MNRAVKDLKFRRRREHLTNYKKRLGMVKSGIDRIIVRTSNRRIIGQVVRYDPNGDRVIAHADSTELAKFKWPSRSNRPTAYLTGLLLAKKAGNEAENDHILDIGLSSPVKNSIPFVFAKGCVEGGLKLIGGMELDEKIYNYSNTRYITETKSKDSARYQRQYSAYIKGGFVPEDLGRLFSDVKDRIMKGAKE